MAAAQQHRAVHRQERPGGLEVVAEPLIGCEGQAAADDQATVQLELRGRAVAGAGRVHQGNIAGGRGDPDHLAHAQHQMLERLIAARPARIGQADVALPTGQQRDQRNPRAEADHALQDAEVPQEETETCFTATRAGHAASFHAQP